MKLTQRFFNILGEFLFPKKPIISILEHMSPSQLYALAQKNIETLEVQSLFIYKDPYIQAGLWELKYRKNIIIAQLFAQLLYNQILIDIELDSSKDIILMPIPLSKKRYKARGYNQGELIIKAMPPTFCNDFSTLIRTRHTPPQTSLPRKKRLVNVRNCFSISNPEKIHNKTIILIDDVCTTGSTLYEAKKTLLKAGAKEVRMYTVAC